MYEKMSSIRVAVYISEIDIHFVLVNPTFHVSEITLNIE